MEDDEKKLRVQKARAEELYCSINRRLKRIEIILAVFVIVMLSTGFFLRIAIFSSENKTDLRYFNLKKVIAMTHNKWVNEYTGEIFDNEAEYKASLAKYPKSKRKNLMQKMFLFLAKQ